MRDRPCCPAAGRPKISRQLCSGRSTPGLEHESACTHLVHRRILFSQPQRGVKEPIQSAGVIVVQVGSESSHRPLAELFELDVAAGGVVVSTSGLDLHGSA